MAKRLWEQLTAGTDIKLWIDPEPYNKTDDEDERDRLQTILDADVAVRTELSDCIGYPDVVAFDLVTQDEINAIKDRLDYYDYVTTVVNLTVHEGAWFSPDSIESVLSEDVGNEADKSIDGNTATFFRDSTNHQHVIVFKLRDYPKKVSKIRFYYGAGESARERLNNIDIHASRGLVNIDDAENILETGINLTWTAGGGVWVEHTLASKKNKARFIKLVIDDTDNGNNQCQIREFEVWVETVVPEG